MKVSKAWLSELVNLKVSMTEVERLLPLRTIATKEITENFIELDMKGYNRADLLSMRGIAYEVAAITNSEVTFNEPAETDYVWVNKELENLAVDVRDDKMCPFYCLVKIEGLAVGKSDTKSVQLLHDSGIREVNNVADVTNLVMLEYGQPMHAFDAAKVDGEMVVRPARENEKIATLDGQDRVLNQADLVIADQSKVLAVAGVMGGKESEITEQTTSILLEAAIFDPASLRQTANRLGMQSESSKRFYHGLTKIRLLQSLDAAIRKYEAMGGKVVALTMVGDVEANDLDIRLRQAKVNSLIGIEIDRSEIEESLAKLNFTLNRVGEGEWKVLPPYWRLDCEIEEDLIEEVARIHGYETIPAKPLSDNQPEAIDQSKFELIAKIKLALVELGLTELQTYSFWSTKVLANLNLNRGQLLKLANPMSAETEYLRTEIWPNLVEKTAENLKKYGLDDIAIFEVGKVYQAVEGQLPKEEYRLSLALVNGSTNPVEELAEIIRQLNQKLALNVELLANREAVVELFHPVRQATIESDGQRRGIIAEVHPRVMNGFGVEQRVAVAELTIGN